MYSVLHTELREKISWKAAINPFDPAGVKRN